MLNISEGAYAKGGNRTLRYQTACGSMSESRACIDASIALGYVSGVDADVLARMRMVIAVLVKNFR